MLTHTLSEALDQLAAEGLPTYRLRLIRLIEAGRLPACRVPARGSNRFCYKIDLEAARELLTADRQAGPKPPPASSEHGDGGERFDAAA